MTNYINFQYNKTNNGFKFLVDGEVFLLDIRDNGITFPKTVCSLAIRYLIQKGFDANEITRAVYSNNNRCIFLSIICMIANDLNTTIDKFMHQFFNDPNRSNDEYRRINAIQSIFCGNQQEDFINVVNLLYDSGITTKYVDKYVFYVFSLSTNMNDRNATPIKELSSTKIMNNIMPTHKLFRGETKLFLYIHSYVYYRGDELVTSGGHCCSLIQKKMNNQDDWKKNIDINQQHEIEMFFKQQMPTQKKNDFSYREQQMLEQQIRERQMLEQQKVREQRMCEQRMCKQHMLNQQKIREQRMFEEIMIERQKVSEQRMLEQQKVREQQMIEQKMIEQQMIEQQKMNKKNDWKRSIDIKEQQKLLLSFEQKKMNNKNDWKRSIDIKEQQELLLSVEQQKMNNTNDWKRSLDIKERQETTLSFGQHTSNYKQNARQHCSACGKYPCIYHFYK
jgi:hypothetical protein